MFGHRAALPCLSQDKTCRNRLRPTLGPDHNHKCSRATLEPPYLPTYLPTYLHRYTHTDMPWEDKGFLMCIYQNTVKSTMVMWVHDIP